MLSLNEFERCGVHFRAALEGDHVTAVRDELELGLGDEAVHGLGLIDGNNLIQRAPNNEDRHLQLGQQVVGDILGRLHGGERALDHPAVAAGAAEIIARNERRNRRRVGHEEGV